MLNGCSFRLLFPPCRRILLRPLIAAIALPKLSLQLRRTIDSFAWTLGKTPHNDFFQIGWDPQSVNGGRRGGLIEMGEHDFHR